jgi:hypothetical protein
MFPRLAEAPLRRSSVNRSREKSDNEIISVETGSSDWTKTLEAVADAVEG